MYKKIILFIVAILSLVSIPLFLLFFTGIFSKAANVPANILVDTQKTTGPFPDRWKALAQGGEEKGVRMLENVVPQLAALYPRSIRLDHIYDYYDIIQRDTEGKLSFDWSKLDETVCDIYHTGAKPFFVLGYMPEVLSGDNTLVSQPRSFEEWSLTVQKTIEHYSGVDTRLCGQVTGYWMQDIYYEVWNEPDLESFGKWSIYGGKDYKTLYRSSVMGAEKAQNVYPFRIGGPVTTRPYRNWFTNFLDFATANNLRVDFLSWHHYSKNTDDFSRDVTDVNSWLADQKYAKYRNLPKIISEWGYDSDPNNIADTNIGAAHTIMSLRNLIEQKVEMAFLFEVKDGVAPSWGILTHEGEKKPRYHALRFLNMLEGERIQLEGEGTYVRGLASRTEDKVTLVLVNYDEENRHVELVPLTLTNLENGIYELTISYIDGNIIKLDDVQITNNQLVRNILMPINNVVALELKRKSL